MSHTNEGIEGPAPTCGRFCRLCRMSITIATSGENYYMIEFESVCLPGGAMDNMAW